MSGVTKRYPGVTALADVNFDVLAGEVHALVGGNGAGKSTLMSIASGSVVPDDGTVEIAGTHLERVSPVAAREHGLAIAFQHPALLPDLTVAENLMLSVPEGRRPSFSGAMSWAREQLLPMGMDIEPGMKVSTLTLAEKQAIEICGALACHPDVIIFDEPTEPFMAEETARLFSVIRDLSARGVAVVYISHRLPDVLALADRITVLRDGQTRGTFDVTDVTEDEIVTRVAGRTVEALFAARADEAGPPVLAAEISAEGLQPTTLTLGRHEIVGLAGVEGNGQRTFIRALGGALSSQVDALVDGVPADLSTPRTARASGIVLMPQERPVEGVTMMHSIRENLAVAGTGHTARGGVISRARERALIDSEVAELGVKAASPDVKVSTLSGGNQQKVSLGRALLSNPKVLLCDEPTQGIDVGVRSDIYHRLRSNAREGVPVVVLSSDNVELAGLCDRVLVFSRGQVVKELVGDEIDDQSITAASLTACDDAHAVRSGEIEPERAPSRLTRLLGSEQGPSLFLMVAAFALVTLGASRGDGFLSSYNISSTLTLLAPVLFLAAGQLLVVLTGGIDLSVGPLSGALVVIASFYLTADLNAVWWVLGVLLMIAAAVLCGSINGMMVRLGNVSPVVTTLITYMALQGVSLSLRDTPGGAIAPEITAALNTTVASIPVAVVIGVLVLAGLELWSRRTISGLWLRGTGSDDVAAHRRGVPVKRVHIAAYIGCSLLTFVGALLLMAQIGVGDPIAGTSYTLASITAVVLGGASIFGGRGSFVGVLCGAALLQTTTTTASFLGMSQAWQYWLPGGMALAATAMFAEAQRRSRRAAVKVL
jgi:ribose transport system ATP-binding protein